MAALIDAPAKPLIYCRRSVIAWRQDAKGETRRLAKPLPDKKDWEPYQDDQGRWWWLERRPRAGFRLIPMRQPYAVGDLLWIREALQHCKMNRTEYAADGVSVKNERGIWAHWKWQRLKLHAMFMPRWACRDYAKVISVREEQLIDIGDEDAIAEGTLVGLDLCALGYRGDAHNLYHDWWDELHKKPGTRSEDNPWTFVYGLEKVNVS